MSSRYLVGDVRKMIATLPDNSVDLVFSSPPFLALRNYLPADDPDKALEIGSESTPGEFLDTLLDVAEACARVLTPHGSVVFELGDTYSGTGGAIDNRETSAGGNDLAPRPPRTNRARSRDTRDGREHTATANTPRPEMGGGDGWPLDKSLCMIPSSFAWALSYGRNPWTGRETDRWRVRNLIAWCRPDPPVGALGDKFRPGTSYLTVACKSRTRWFDLDAVRTEPVSGAAGEVIGTDGTGFRGFRGITEGGPRRIETVSHPGGAPPLDWWEIPTQPYAGSHYATFPEKLVVRPVEAMCPREVCRQCGEPRRRLTERSEGYAAVREAVGDFNRRDEGQGSSGPRTQQMGKLTSAENITVGWSDCGHDDYRRGIVLDPFAGSGTTLAVAEGVGRDSVGIDLDRRNVELALKRCGMFLTVDLS